ncbi:ABC transporter substrate-binding protein, partial [Streptomyces scabiei]|uniref:ABC transporter substrate-binding protein n=2 Tax=Streptomyces TaxID=1883 RepID=UPI0039F07402
MDAVRRAARPSRRGVLRAGGGAALAAVAGTAVTGCGAGTDDGVAADGTVTVEMWHGQADTAKKVLEGLVADFERAHPKIRVKLGGGVLSDVMLQKVTAALAAGSYPDIAYIFGSDLARVARSPQVVDLTDTVGSGPVPWKNYWAASRDAVTLNGRVRAAPAVL